MSHTNSLRSLVTLAASAALAAACSSEPATAPWAARPSLIASSRNTVASSDRHVFLMKGAAPMDFAAHVAARGGTIVSDLSQIGVVVTSGLADADAAALAGPGDEVARDVVAQWLPPAEGMQVADASLAGTVSASSINPPQAAAFLSLQWNMQQIHAPEAWNQATGIPSVRVAMLDTGIDPDHIDMMGATVIDQAASTAFVPSTMGPPAWADDNGHGTLTGAIVTSNNIGVAGVAPDVRLIAVKVLGADGTGPLGAVVAGIVYATDAGAQVINMSLGVGFPKNEPDASTVLSVFNRAIAYAKRHGVLVVSAAGNEAIDLQHDGNLVYIPCEAGVQLCVSATTRTETPASYTNYGASAIAVAAPGGDGPPSAATWILGPCSSRIADPAFAACKNRVSYIIATGTSASAPHVAGLGALLDSKFGGRLDASQLITLIQRYADDLGKPGVDQFYGQGRINALSTISTTTP